MRILHVVGGYLPGQGYEENYLPQEQARMGNEVILVTSDRLPHDFSRLAGSPRPSLEAHPRDPSVRSDGVEVIRLPSVPGPLGANLFVGLRRVLARRSPDVVHAHEARSPNTLQCLLAQRRLRYALIVDDHSHSRNVRLAKAYQRAYIRGVAAAYRLLNRSVATFLAVTPAARIFLERRLRIPRRRIRLGALGADAKGFAPSSQARARGRRDLAVPPDATLILMTGKFSPTKDPETLVRGFARASRRHDDAWLMLAGTGDPAYIGRLRGLLEELDVSERTTLRGIIPHEELSRAYNAADIGVWPGAHSITVLEALSTGLPCILPGDDAAYRPIVEAGACLGFRTGNVASLAESLEFLLSDPDARRVLASKGRALIEQRFSWGPIASGLMEVYEEATQSLGGPWGGRRAPGARSPPGPTRGSPTARLHEEPLAPEEP